jgi:hypothetical protein
MVLLMKLALLVSCRLSKLIHFDSLLDLDLFLVLLIDFIRKFAPSNVYPFGIDVPK